MSVSVTLTAKPGALPVIVSDGDNSSSSVPVGTGVLNSKSVQHVKYADNAITLRISSDDKLRVVYATTTSNLAPESGPTVLLRKSLINRCILYSQI